MSLLENIQTGARQSVRQELSALNKQIEAAERDLAGLKADRDHLLEQLDRVGRTLSTVTVIDEVQDDAPDYASASQWQPADSLDQETADPPAVDDTQDYDPSDPPVSVRQEHDRIDAEMSRAERVNRLAKTAEQNLGRSLTAEEEFGLECSSDA